MWGTRGRWLVQARDPAAHLQDAFESIIVGPSLDSPYAMPDETEHPILVCRGLRLPLAEA